MSTISKFAGRVVCTKAQFDALAEKDPNKEYLVTDDDTYGGGKYYMHRVKITANLSYFEKAENKSVTESTDIYINIISSNNVPVTNINGLISLAKQSDIVNHPAYINNTKIGGILNAEFSSSGALNLRGMIIIYSPQNNYGLVNSVVPPVESLSTITDTVVEL